MARPQQPILLSTDDDDTRIDIITAESLWMVVYQDMPINIRITKLWQLTPGKKYKKTCFPTKKVADNMAAELNTLFMTEDFTVKEIK